MAFRFSPALQNYIAEGGSWKSFFDNGSIEVFTGSQPATPDLATTGTQLLIITSSGGTKTNEVPATGNFTLAVGAVGTDTLATVTLAGVNILGGAVAFATSLNATATAAALAINRCTSNKFVVATTTGSSAVVTLTAKPGFGTTLNAVTLATTVGGNMTAAVNNATFGTLQAGVAAVNGLLIDYNAAAGVITKNTTQTWSGTVIGAGTQTAGWFRYKGSVVDANAQDSSAVFLRMDGAVATSGSDMNMTSTSMANGAVQTVGTFQWTIPAA
jgi:hypothetical protein